jgi:hypothetical protein
VSGLVAFEALRRARRSGIVVPPDVASRLGMLRELADLENPMRTPIGSQPGLGALLDEAAERDHGLGKEDEERAAESLATRPHAIDELVPPDASPADVTAEPPPDARPAPGRSRSLPTVLPDPSPDGVRSRFDPDEGVVYYNDRHPDYLLLKADEPASARTSR